MKYRLIEDSGTLEDALDQIEDDLDGQDVPRLYLDTEFESNRSGTKLCLLQISAGKQNFLVDPLRLKSLGSLSELLSDRSIEWILHAGLQDVELITKNLRVPPPRRLLDTQIAWALVSPESSVSLAYLKFRLLGTRAEKAHQADDWVRRPLQASQLRYAAADVDDLPKMTELLLEQAGRLGRQEIVYAASKDSLQPEKEPPAPLSLASFRNAWQLSPKSQSGLRFLMDWYNELPFEARRSAPDTKGLLAIASRCPENEHALARIKGVPRGTVKDYGAAIVDGIAHAIDSAQSSDFVPLDPPSYATFEEIELDAWLARFKAHLAVSLECAPELVLPGRLLKRIKAGVLASGTPGLLESLVGWRRDLLLEPAQAFCKTAPPPV